MGINKEYYKGAEGNCVYDISAPFKEEGEHIDSYHNSSPDDRYA